MREFIIEDKNKSEIGKAFFEFYLENGFGTKTKKDLDIFLYYLLQDQTALSSYSIFEIANYLKITDSKVKNLILESGLRYPNKNINYRNRILIKIVDSILLRYKNNIEFDGKYVEFVLENPTERRVFENTLKEADYYSDTSFNKEIVKVKLVYLFNSLDKIFPKFQEEFIKKLKTDKKSEGILINKTLNFGDRVEKILSNHKETTTTIITVFETLSKFLPILFNLP